MNANALVLLAVFLMIRHLKWVQSCVGKIWRHSGRIEIRLRNCPLSLNDKSQFVNFHKTSHLYTPPYAIPHAMSNRLNQSMAACEFDLFFA